MLAKASIIGCTGLATLCLKKFFAAGRGTRGEINLLIAGVDACERRNADIGGVILLEILVADRIFNRSRLPLRS